MTPKQIDLLLKSFTRVFRVRADAGLLFYDRLFAIAPELEALFKGDIVVQATKLVNTLAYALGSLHDTPALSEVLKDLGTRHMSYGVRPSHYPLVGSALLWTLAEVLGPAFDFETEAAWVCLYQDVARAMITAPAPENATISGTTTAE